MEQYINKSALVSEIYNILGYVDEYWDTDYVIGAKMFTDKLQDAINTLEVKEADLDVMQRMEECPFRKVGCEIYEGHILECEGTCGWIVDHLKSKELKAQKGKQL